MKARDVKAERIGHATGNSRVDVQLQVESRVVSLVQLCTWEMADQQPRFEPLTEEQLSLKFQSAAAGSAKDANDFFGRFKYVEDLWSGNYSAAFDGGIHLLHTCLSIDRDSYRRIHKGTPYYWVGTAAFVLHDFQTAAFFYDAAVSEDLRAGYHPIDNPTPALRFIQMAGEPRDQAARQLVQLAQSRIEEIIEDYNNRPDTPANVAKLNIVNLRKRFLTLAVSPGLEKWRSLATALISFVLEWNHRKLLLDLRVEQGTAEPFYIHLFKGCVLFESLLKANPSKPPPKDRTTLGLVLQYLYQELGIPHNIKISEEQFNTIVQEVDKADNSLSTAVQYAGRIRNTVGHDLGWVGQMDSHQYRLLFEMVAVSCLHAIACLYPDPMTAPISGRP